jgi:flavin reductase (DIM6/NTAB) family NADH-FMN oxidoreductase RutF
MSVVVWGSAVADLDAAGANAGPSQTVKGGLRLSASPSIDGARFREVLAHVPTGVTIITSNSADGPTGMTANSFTSVSLSPPLVLFCPAKSSSTWPTIRSAGTFCVNVMASHHEQLIRQFAHKAVDRFAGVAYTPGQEAPALDGAAVWLMCRIHAEYDAGDHTVVVAEVTRLDARTDTEPLVLCRGRYGRFQEVVGEDRGR